MAKFRKKKTLNIISNFIKGIEEAYDNIILFIFEYLLSGSNFKVLRKIKLYLLIQSEEYG